MAPKPSENDLEKTRPPQFKHKKNKTWFSFLAWLRSYDQFGKPVGLTMDGDDVFKTLQGGIVSVGFMTYIYYLFITSLIPVVLGEIDSSQTQTIFYDTTIPFDPFAYGFNFAVGFNQPLPANIGTW